MDTESGSSHKGKKIITFNQTKPQGENDLKFVAASMQQQSQYTIYQGGRDVRREPPPYPGYSRGFQQTAGYRQSYASSETGSTDMSLSSCENLSTSMRQDPQGEETRHPGILSSPIDMAQNSYHIPGYIQGSPTAVEVKSANSSTFYVTGSVPNQIEDLNLAGNYSTAPQMQYTNMGHTIGDMRGQSIMVPSMTVASCDQQQFIPQPQGYNTNQLQEIRQILSHMSNGTDGVLHQVSQQAQPYNTNQYYTQGTTGHNQNTQMYITHQNTTTNQPQQPVNQQQTHLQQQQQHYSNLPVNNTISPPQHYDNVHQTNSTAGTTPSPQSASKQDPFKKWRHFYVNQKTQLQQYRLLQQGNEQSGNQGSANNQKFDSQGQFNEVQSQCNEVQGHPQHQPYVNDINRTPSSLRSSNTENIGSGSMIARLRQEFSNKQTNHNNTSAQNSSSEQNTAVSNVRATNERIRSATPDFLSDRPLVAKQLPLRPSSANSKQRNQDRQFSFSQIKAQKLNKQKTETVNSDQKNSDSSSPEVDDNANKIVPKLNPNLQPLSDTSMRSQTNQSINCTSAGLVQQARDQLEQQVKSPGLTRQQHPRTASPQHSKTVLSPPPAYPGGLDSDSSTITTLSDTKKEMHRSYEMLDRLPSNDSSSRPDLSSSQPDLTQLVGGLSIHHSSSESRQGTADTSQIKLDKPFRGSSSDSQDSNRSKSNELDHAAIATRATQMVERLSEENRSLRQELEGYYSKVCRLQKFEGEIQKVTDSYEALVKHTSKRENLDKAMRLRLETEIKRLRENNRDLKDQLEKALSKMDASGVYALTGDAELKRELKEKDTLITKLISQNRELYKLRDKFEADLIAQKQRCETYTNHIEILETTLKSCQKDKMKLEDQVSHCQENADKVDKLQHVLAQFKTAAEKRETIEQKLRSKLEEEVRTLKTQKYGAVGKASDTDEGISSDYETPSRWQWMSQQMQDKDQEILKLQAQVAHYEQKFVEETAMRQLAVDVASVPKDAKIAALEVNSHETERLIDEAKSDRLKHLEELYNSSKKAAEFEAQVKTLTAQLAEKEAVIRVLQKQSFSLSRTSSVSSLFTSPLHSPHQSITASSPGHQGSRNNSRPSSGLALPISPVLSHRELAKLAVHSKSNSEGAVLDLNNSSSNTSTPSNSSVSSSTRSTCSTVTATTTVGKTAGKPALKNNKTLRQVLAEQAKLFQSWQKEQPDDLTKECWQV